jgi:hypothetical protein
VDTEALARQIAIELSGEFPNLPRDLEIAIVESHTRLPEKHLTFDLSTAVPLAALLLAAVKLGWDIWRDIAKPGASSPPDAVDLKVSLSKELDTTIEAHNIDARSVHKILDIVAKRIASAGK